MAWLELLVKHLVQKKVASLLKGCKCATGCSLRCCSCVKKKKSKCSVGCECINCTNVSAHQSLNDSELADVAIEEELTTIDARDVEDIMDWAS